MMRAHLLTFALAVFCLPAAAAPADDGDAAAAPDAPKAVDDAEPAPSVQPDARDPAARSDELDEERRAKRRAKRRQKRERVRRDRARERVEVEERGFFASHFPFGMPAEPLDPLVDEKFWLAYLMSLFFGAYAGPLWIPDVMLKTEMPPGYTDAALWHWLTDIGLSLLTIPMALSGLLCFGVGYFVTFPLAVVYSLAFNLYFRPLSDVLFYDEWMKKGAASGRRSSTAGRRNDRDAQLPPKSPALAMAY